MNLLQPYTAPRQGDPYWDNVVLHLKAKGANASTVFGDAKGHPITPYGNAQISTTQSKFGGAAMYFDGTGDYCLLSDSDDWYFPDDYTAEFYIYPVSFASSTYNFILVQGAAWWGIGVYGSSADWRLMDAGGSYVTLTGGSGAVLTTGSWQHLAFARSGTTLRLFLNGVLVGSCTDSGARSNYSYALAIGAASNGTYFFTGYLDDIRITKGVARYTASFTPPAAPNPIGILRSPLDVLLMPFNGANGSTAFHDQTGKAITAYGNASISTSQSKFGGTSGYFDGTGDYLGATGESALAVGTGDYTAECFAYSSSYSGAGSGLFGFGTGFSAIGLAVINASLVEYYAANTYHQFNPSTYSASVSTGSWHHYAVCRQAGTTTVFIDGIKCHSTSSDTLDISSTAVQVIGSYYSTGYPWNGYIDDLRITKGLARYTQNFDPPSRSFEQLYDPYTDWTKDPYLGNVVLHCPFNESVGDTKGHTVTAYGNAAVSATQSKLGGKSCYFDGTGDYLLVPDMAFGYSDFTIEFWMYTGTNSTEPLSTYSAGGWQFYINGSTMRFYKASNTPLITGTTNVCSSTWVHVAVTRSGTTARMFINGTQEGGDQTDSSNYNDTNMYVGSYDGTSYYFNGYLDDLRITKGIARYTANFTPEPRQSPEY